MLEKRQSSYWGVKNPNVFLLLKMCDVCAVNEEVLCRGESGKSFEMKVCVRNQDKKHVVLFLFDC